MNTTKHWRACLGVGSTSKADSFWWRFAWKFFQSSFAVATLAWTPSAFSLVSSELSSSPLDSIVFNLCCPLSLSDRNSYEEKQKIRYLRTCQAVTFFAFFLRVSVKSRKTKMNKTTVLLPKLSGPGFPLAIQLWNISFPNTKSRLAAKHWEVCYELLLKNKQEK